MAGGEEASPVEDSIVGEAQQTVQGILAQEV
jgi:hypothetical protein